MAARSESRLVLDRIMDLVLLPELVQSSIGEGTCGNCKFAKMPVFSVSFRALRQAQDKLREKSLPCEKERFLLAKNARRNDRRGN
jgi:hypothetical protein